MINVGDLVIDPDLCSNFTILRTTGSFKLGGWVKDPVVTIASYGAVRNSNGKELEMLPEADRPKNALTFRTAFPLYVTTEQGSMLSDILVFHGEQHRILTVKDYSEQGYWFAMAVRMEGN